MEYDIDDDEDDLFEDANEQVPQDNQDEGLDRVDDDDADDNENEDENMDDEEEDEEEEEIDGDDSDDNLEATNVINQEKSDVPVSNVEIVDSTVEPAEITDKLSFKQAHPIECSQDMIDCQSYDIIPTVGISQGAGINAIAVSWGLKLLFTGGEDGFIRKYNFIDSIEGKVPLTAAQKHNFVDSMINSGALVSYFENEQPILEKDAKVGSDGLYEPKLSPAYSLVVQSEALWILSGLESGGITLQTVRHNEGQIHAYLNHHKSTVSVLKLDDGERRLLSGSWDKTVIEWDLDTGNPIHVYDQLSSQVSSIEWQPQGGTYVHSTGENSISDINSSKIQANGNSKNADDDSDDDKKSMESLFGDDDDKSNNASHQSPESTTEQEQNNVPVQNQAVFMTSCIDGTIDIWDLRMQTKAAHVAPKRNVTPPWCSSACWSTDGNKLYAGRRNSTVDEYDIRRFGDPIQILKFPSLSGPVSSVCSLPSGRHLLCGSQDNVRLYDLSSKPNKVPFLIIPGHRGGVLSSIYVDPSCRNMVTSSGSRGWQGTSTDVVIIYNINPVIRSH